MMKDKKGQVWVETVIYTLIGLVLIGTVLAFAVPFINEQKDRVTIEKTSESLNALDNVILNAKGQGIGNKREFNFLIGRGNLIVDGERNRIQFRVEESEHAYSEPGITVNIPGTNLKVNTRSAGEKYDVTLTLEYDERIDIVYDEENVVNPFTAAPNPYNLIIENLGKVPAQMECTTGQSCDNADVEIGTCNAGGFCVPTYTKINIFDGS
tara:strand:+ start:1739 stop:2368 length:630 start_codon:yes stop_codon:yes gene_type:complete